MVTSAIILYIIFGVGFIIGIIFIRRGLSRHSHKGGLPMVIRDDPIVPSTFDISFIEQQLIKIQNNPGMIGNYITATRAKYGQAKEREVLDALQQKFLSRAKVIEARKRESDALRDLKLSDWELGTVDEDIRIRSKTRRVQEAELDQKIRTFSEPPKAKTKHESEVEEYERKKRADLEKRRIDRNIKTEEGYDDLEARLQKVSERDNLLQRQKQKLVEARYPGKKLHELSVKELDELRNDFVDLEDKIDQFIKGQS